MGLQEEELRHPAVTDPAPAGSPAILVKNGSFAWEAGGIPLLRHVSLEVPSGRLIVVIGEVGSGVLFPPKHPTGHPVAKSVRSHVAWSPSLLGPFVV